MWLELWGKFTLLKVGFRKWICNFRSFKDGKLSSIRGIDGQEQLPIDPTTTCTGPTGQCALAGDLRPNEQPTLGKNISFLDCKILQNLAKSCKFLQNPLKSSKSCKILQNPEKSCKILQNPAKSYKILQNPAKSYKILHNKVLQTSTKSCKTL